MHSLSHSGYSSRSSTVSARSPSYIFVQVISAEICSPGPAMPSTSPLSSSIRLWVWSTDRAESRVCGSSRRTSDGRMIEPSTRVCCWPRMLASRLVVVMIEPHDGLISKPSSRSARGRSSPEKPSTVGKTNLFWPQWTCVSRPWQCCWSWRLEEFSSARSGWTASGKSASSSGFSSMCFLMGSSSSLARSSAAPIRQMNGR